MTFSGRMAAVTGAGSGLGRAIARMLAQLARNGLDNVRIVEADAVAAMEYLVPVRSVDELWLFFPDPWHKARHHKRRLLTPDFAALSAARLKPLGIWRAAGHPFRATRAGCGTSDLRPCLSP